MLWCRHVVSSKGEGNGKAREYGNLDACDCGRARVRRWLRERFGLCLILGLSAHPHAKLFSTGKGRAYVGFSEAMNDMGDYAQQVSFRPLSLAEGENVDVLYADFASVNARIDAGKRDLAVEFLNLLTSSDMLVAASLPSEGQTTPQYLLLPRLSTYDVLERDYPLYAKLRGLLQSPNAHVFLVMSDGKKAIEHYETALNRAGVAE